jgi:hypothetical protein
MEETDSVTTPVWPAPSYFVMIVDDDPASVKLMEEN